MVKITTTDLRQNLYRILDRILETGEPVEISRHGRTLKIVPQEEPGRLERLEPHDVIAGNPEELVHVDWSEYWSGSDPGDTE